jgi:ankyrin repeat protein
MEPPSLAQLAVNGNLTLQIVKTTPIETFNTVYAGFTVLYCAVQNCDIDVVEAILDRGIDINELSTTDGYCNIMGALTNNKWDMVMLLLRRGANVQVIATKKQLSVLHFAVTARAPANIIIALIEAGADPTVKNIEGKTPSDVARHVKTTAIADLLDQYSIKPIKSANFNV